MTNQSPIIPKRPPAFLAGGGEMGALMRAHDWSSSSLGLPAGWPQALRTAVRLMLNCGHPMYIWWGEDGACLYNDAYRRSIGPERHPGSLGRPMREVWAEIWDIIGPQIDQVMSGRGATWHENHLVPITRNGRREDVYWTYSYSPIDDETAPNGVGGVLVVCSETTQSVKALDRVWNNSRDLLVVVGADGIFRAVSPSWTRALGHLPEEVVGRSFLDFIHPDDAVRTQGGLETAASGEELTNFENRYLHKDGSPRWISWRTSAEDDLVYVYGRDITAEKAATAALAQAEEALRQSQKLEAMGQLTGGVAHDFNNLLMPIIASLDMLQRRKLGGEREQRMIAGGLQSADRAKTLVQRLLAFARRQPLQPVAVDVSAVVGGMVGLIASVSGPQISVAVDLADDLPAAHADANQLEMAILNLSVNARDAMPEGGTLRVSARREWVGGPVAGGHPAPPQHAPNQPRGLKPGCYVRLSIADTGAGMDEATLARAVEPFFSTKGVGKGTGLGLSMAHGLASQLGGALAISSKRGLGTNVELWLPASADPVAAASTAPQEEAAPSSAGTVLLVDDEELVRMSTAEMLTDLGYAVKEAGSADEALKAIDSGMPIDLLITDHLMPGMSGVELAHAARALRLNLPVLIVSGFAEADTIAADLPRLTKPFRSADLQASLAGVLPVGKAEAMPD